MRHAASAFAALALLVGAGQVKAGLITFESAPSSFTTYTEQGVTFTGVGGGEVIASLDPNGTNGLLGNESPRQMLRADIGGGATSVSVDLGDFGADADNLMLSVFDSSDNLLASTSLIIPDTFNGLETLTVSAPNIAYAIFGSGPPSLNGSSVYADNFTWSTESPNPAPEPASLTLLGLGAFGLLGYGWRRRKVAAG